MESWLTTNEYTIPEGASDAFDPYVQDGSYFFVAKVKADEVTFRVGYKDVAQWRQCLQTTDKHYV
jgi:hypothetical protein